MNAIETPVMRPTASSIWNAFRSSGKRHILLTGRMGIGKTTLLSALFPHKRPGITTWAEPQRAVWMQDNRTLKKQCIAQYDPAIRGTKAKMTLLENRMEQFGCAILQHCQTERDPWVTIDEIGFLEENCVPFQNAIRTLMDTKQVAAVVRQQDLPFLNELRQRPDVFLVDLDAPFPRCGCVIMASGLGKRFGENKLMTDFCGQPLISRILDTTASLFAKRVVVTRHDSVQALCAERSIPTVLHALPYRSDTVRLGLEALGDVEMCMFCPGDQPLLQRDTLAALLLSAAQAPDEIWRPSCNGTPGAPVLFPRWAFPLLRALPQGKGGGAVIQSHPQQVRFMQVDDPWELVDADTPETLAQLKGRRA